MATINPSGIDQSYADMINQFSQDGSQTLKTKRSSTASNAPFAVPLSLDDYFQTTSLGSINKALGNNLYGINHQQVSNMVSSNWDLYGLTFFTRPQLNLQSDNIRNVRQLYSLLNDAPESINKYVRLNLDPRLQWGYDPLNLQVATNIAAGNILSDSYRGTGYISTSLVDPFNAFISVLTNNLAGVSGWPEMVTPTFTSERGLYNQTVSQVDGSVKLFSDYDLDVTFRNTRGDPIVYMFYIWIWYASLVFEGYITPYPDFIAENELDYCTRIYRLVLDPTRTYVTKMAATGAAFPISLPMGSFFDFTTDKPYNDQNKEFTVRFRAMGATYMDDILIWEFNKTVGIFQPSINQLTEYNTIPSNLVKVDKSLVKYFNNMGYPYIDPNTYELQWWVDADSFNRRMGVLASNQSSTAMTDLQNSQIIPQRPIMASV